MSSNTPVQPIIFREYIGAKPGSGLTDFPDIINQRVKQFHYILAFAIEDYDETKKSTGKFKPKWNLSVFDVESIQRLKEKYGNVKVVISIGGRGREFPFNPAEKQGWLSNAKESLKHIFHQFGTDLIDGIDVNYEVIKSSDDDFAESLGNLIKGLKNDCLIKVASIAPSNSTRLQYLRLYQIYQDNIDWVNYQFYTETLSNMQDFENLYQTLSRDYKKNNLLVGFSTDPNDGGKISRKVFLEGCQDLFERKLLPGIFVWDADDSKSPGPHENPFECEELAQQMIADFSLRAA